MLSALLIVIGIALWAWYLFQPIEIWVNGNNIQIHSIQLTTGGILSDAGIPISAGDKVYPDIASLFFQNRPIVVWHNASYNVSIDGQVITTYSTDRFPANVLGSLGLKLFPRDELKSDGLPISMDGMSTIREQHTIQLARSKTIFVNAVPISTASDTVGEIFWQLKVLHHGYKLSGAQDNNIISDKGVVQLSRPATLSILTDNAEQAYLSSGNSIGQAAVLLGLAPQGLDNSPIPLDQTIQNNQPQYQVNRIEERLDINQKSLSFTYQTNLDDSLPLDQQKVTQVGEFGLAMQLSRTRIQDGIEIDTKIESETVLQPPKDEITGYGTRIDIQSMDAGGTTIQYYRAISLYATSYSPCRSGSSKCSTGTASGEPAGKGIVAVIPGWYAYMSGQQVYIPGYGFAIIGDTGGGIPGTNWIDLGYNDADYVPWHSWVTVYFLTPVPDNILYALN